MIHGCPRNSKIAVIGSAGRFSEIQCLVYLEYDYRRMLRVAIKEGLEERRADPADVEHRHPHMTAPRRSRGAVLPELYRTLPVSIGHSVTPRTYRGVILVKRSSSAMTGRPPVRRYRARETG